MNRQPLQLIGTLILIAGLALGAVGAHRILTNQPISDAEALNTAKRALSAEDSITEGREEASIRQTVELQIWQSALKLTNKDRKKRRTEGAVLLVSGVIAAMWGITVLVNSLSASDEF